MVEFRKKIAELEKNIEGNSKNNELDNSYLVKLPEELQLVFKYKIFGNNLLAIPAKLINENDDEEFEKPFKFLDSLSEIEVFESEFRSEIPDNFIQIGSFYDSTEIVLLDVLKKTIHVFHISDIVDSDWLNYKLNKEICDLNIFLNNIQLQTVCCLINPENYSEYDIFEIRNGTDLKSENENIEFPNFENVQIEYIKRIKLSFKKGFKIHYAPQKVLNELEK
ncbi:MAG: hypothetical protein J7574_13875 [Flavobacterium sp.]|uniref:hypothetical protein n=1 Tax=Flavobacterium sp. TaxID=239 RepID=UPI001B008941|nr:hypothetical protein [Flavobacterium sp.]MBO9585246.1 hypothetical protein [Flavobacterium sp.]